MKLDAVRKALERQVRCVQLRKLRTIHSIVARAGLLNNPGARIFSRPTYTYIKLAGRIGSAVALHTPRGRRRLHYTHIATATVSREITSSNLQGAARRISQGTYRCPAIA